MRWISIAGVFPALALGCVASDVASETESVVYGADDRRDVYDHPDTALAELARTSIVAIMRSDVIDASDPSNIRFVADTLGDRQGLCPGQRFASDPAAAFCSGTLIDDNLVLTAGHCFPEPADCASARIVFGYYRDSATTLHTVTSADVFSCAEVVAREQGETPSGVIDYAIIRLDRSAAPRFSPAPVATGASPVVAGQNLAIMGSGSGIPIKIDSGGQVADPRASTMDYFTATTDSFGGNSGSGIFDASRQVIGILVRGARDYREEGTCMVVNECASVEECGDGESINYVHHAIRAYCARAGSTRLCGSAVACGNGRCEPGESSSSCPADCPLAACGNGVCDTGESAASCAADCGSTVPAGWTCSPAYYAVGDDCDCSCGVRDPDCDNPALRILGCGPGEQCGADGRCGAGGGIPATWTCNAAYYGVGDDCDCGCGAYDPDCNDRSLRILGCADGQSCGADGRCTDMTSGVPPEWICSAAYYGVGDDCDCSCGAYDPDCDDPSLRILGCEAGEMCGFDGRCTIADSDPPPGSDASGGCSAAPREGRVPLVFLLAAVAYVLRRRSSS